jgi:hypothetical protein
MKLQPFASSVAVALLVGCSTVDQATDKTESTRPDVTSSTSMSVGGQRITAQMMGARYGSMTITGSATDDAFAYSEAKPVKIGGGFGEGAERTYRFLNSLSGPNGEPVRYDRVGTCCSFKTPNSPFGDEALLEVFEVTYDGIEQPKHLYFNWYDEGEVLVPLGLRSR